MANAPGCLTFDKRLTEVSLTVDGSFMVAAEGLPRTDYLIIIIIIIGLGCEGKSEWMAYLSGSPLNNFTILHSY